MIVIVADNNTAIIDFCWRAGATASARPSGYSILFLREANQRRPQREGAPAPSARPTLSPGNPTKHTGRRRI